MICANFDNPIEKQQFLEMESIFGKNTAQWLWHLNNGYPLDKTNTGNDSMLFKELNDITGNKKTAMLLKAQIYKNRFDREPTIKEFLSKITPKQELSSHSVNPKTLTYKDVNRAMTEEVTQKIITGNRIKQGDHINEVRFEFGAADTTYRVAKKAAIKINSQYGEGTATLDTRNPKSITMFVNFAPEKITNQLALEVELAKQKEEDRNTDDMLTRQIEGNWKVNNEGDVVPIDDYDFQDYLPLGQMTTKSAAAFPNTFDDFIKEKEARLKELEHVQQRLRKELRYSGGNDEIAKKIQDLRFRISELKEDIYKIKKEGAFKAIFGTIADKDFKRIEELLKKKDGDSLVEAKKLIDYYVSVGIYDKEGNTNPFFSVKGVSLSDAPEDIRITLAEISGKASKYNDEYRENLKTIAYNTLIDHPNYAKLYPNGISMDEVFADVEDIDWLSEMFLAVDFTFSGQDSILGQIIKELFERKLLGKIATAKSIIENIDALLPKVNRELLRLNEFRTSFLGALSGHRKVPLYSIFYQRNDLGHIMPVLIDKLSQDWYNFVSHVSFEVDKAYKAGKSPDEANSIRYKEIQKQARLFDFRKLPSLFSGHDAFKGATGIPWASAADEQAYRNELIAEMGQSKFDDFVEQQVSKLDEYVAYKEKLFADVNQRYVGLPQVINAKIKQQMYARSPLQAFNVNPDGGIPYSYVDNKGQTQSRTAYTTLEFNMYIPLKGANKMYNDEFSKIESNPILYEFWTVMREATRNINESVPFKAKYATSIMSMNRGILEAVIDKRVGQKRQFATLAGIKDLTRDTLVNFFSTESDDFDEQLLKKQNDQTKVNDSKFKTVESRIERKVEIELKEVSQILHLQLNSTTLVDLNTTKPEMIEYLGRLLGVKSSIAEIAKAAGGNTDIYITKFVRAEIGRQEMLRETLNLPKVLKYYLAQAAHYDAANEIIPMLSGLKNLYNAIKSDSTNNVVRKNANERMDNWFDRVIRGYRIRQKPQKGIKVYTSDEKKEKERLQRLIKSSTSQQEKDDYQKEIDKLGGVVNVNSIWNVINTMIIWNGLTYNIRSSMFNYTYGYLQSLYVDQLGDYWTPGNFNTAFNFVLGKGRKNLGKYGGWAVHNWRNHAEQIKLAELFVNKTYIIQDMRNEKQKASTNLGKKELAGGLKNIAKPYYLSVTAVEWRNQTADILCVLMDTEIKDRDGVAHKIFDGNKFTCFEDVGGKLMLKDEFRHYADGTEIKENIQNWEDMSGDKFKSFHISATSAIRMAQGDYSPTGGMKIKGNQLGKTAMIFNTWLPMMLWTRFGKGKVLSSGITREHRVYSTHNPFTLAVLAGVATAATVATSLATAGIVAGAVLVAASIVRAFAKNISVKGDVNYVMELAMTLKAIGMRTIGFPVNLALNALPVNARVKDVFRPNLEKDLKIRNAQDARAMQFILMEIAVGLNMIMMKMAAIWALSCEEKTISCERRTKIKNFLDNTFTRIILDTTLYLNPIKLAKSLKDGAFVMYIDKILNFIPAVDKFVNGDDIIEGGEYSGDSRFLKSVDKTLVPSVLSINHLSPLYDSEVRKAIKQDPYTVFDIAMPHQQDQTQGDVFNRMFESDMKKAESSIEHKRSSMKKSLKRQGFNDKYIRERLDDNYPTIAQKRRKLMQAVDRGDMTQNNAVENLKNYIDANK